MRCYLCDRQAEFRCAVSKTAEAAFCRACKERWKLFSLEAKQMAAYAATPEPTTLEHWPPVLKWRDL